MVSPEPRLNPRIRRFLTTVHTTRRHQRGHLDEARSSAGNACLIGSPRPCLARSHHPVTGDDDGQRIGTVGESYRSGSARIADVARQTLALEVGASARA